MSSLKVSKNEMKLLLILLSIMILGVSYQFIYRVNVEKTEVVLEEVSALESQVNLLQDKERNREKITKEIEEMKVQIKELSDDYGVGNTMEKNLLFVRELEKNASMTIENVSMSEDEYYLTPTKEGDGFYRYGSSNVSKERKQSEEESSIDFGILSGYKTTISINFKGTYENLKKCLDYIHEYDDKRNVGEITLSYDSETGNLMGNMTIWMYHLLGTGEGYVDPPLDGGKLGLDNIFGTIELP